MILYHCNRLILNSGDIIAPGTWVEKLMEVGPSHPLWSREMMVESIRLKYYDNKPSRLFSTFGYETLEAIMLYKNIHMPEGYLYRVEHTDKSLHPHRGDYHDIQSGGLTPAHLSTISLRYWELGHRINVLDWPQIKGCEVISASPLLVLEVISL